MGLEGFRKIQIGTEVVRGTAVAATAKLHGGRMTQFKELRKVEFPAEDRGYLARNVRSRTGSVQASLAFEGDVLFQDICYFLNAGIIGGITGAGGGADKTWSFTPNMTSQNSPTTFTIEYGDDVQCWEAEYCFATALTISGSPEEALKLRANLVGRQLTATTFTGALSDRTVEAALFQKTALYLDDAAPMGTTIKAATLIDFQWKLNTGFTARPYADNALYFTNWGEAKRMVELDMTFEFNSIANAERAKWTSEAIRLVRIKTLGSALGGSNYALVLDTWGKYIDWDTLDSKDGTDTVRVKLQSQYDGTATKDFAVSVVNNIAALP